MARNDRAPFRTNATERGSRVARMPEVVGTLLVENEEQTSTVCILLAFYDRSTADADKDIGNAGRVRLFTCSHTVQTDFHRWQLGQQD